MEKAIIQFVAENPDFFSTLGYYIVFFSGFLESMPLFGFIVPGQTIIILAGVTAKLGAISYFYISLLAFIGAFIGDLASFIIGKKYGDTFIRLYGKKFFISEEQYITTKLLIAEHPAVSIIFGRLNSITRSLAPFAAGASNVKTGKFVLYSFIGSLTWAFLFTSIGFVVGSSISVLIPALGKFIFLATALALVLIVVIRQAKKKQFHFSPFDTTIFIINIISIYIFSALAQNISNNISLTNLDEAVHQFFINLPYPLFSFLSIWIGSITASHILVFAALAAATLALEKRVRDACYCFITLISGTLAVYIAKVIFLRARPSDAIIVEAGGSFPSGHAALSLILGALFYQLFFATSKSKAVRIISAVIIGLVVLSTGVSRLYLNVHWITDIIGGFAFGAWWLTLSIILWKLVPWAIKKITKKHEIPNL